MVVADVISRFQSIATESNPLTHMLVHDFYPAILNLIKKEVDLLYFHSNTLCV